MNIQPPRHILSPLLLSEFGVRGLSLKKCRGGVGVGVETEMTMSAVEELSSERPHTPEIEENRSAKQCRN
jgi:hypothetical protein